MRARSGMADAFEMMQSRTFVQQFGYGLLRIGLVALFPELKLLFRKIDSGALDPPAAAKRPDQAPPSSAGQPAAEGTPSHSHAPPGSAGCAGPR